MQEVLIVVTVVVTGLMVGVEFSVAAFVKPIFDRLPDDASLVARRDSGRVLGRLMPFWYIGSVLLAVIWTVLVWGRPPALTLMVAVALLLASVVMSVALLVPINNRAIRWSAESLPADWKQQIGRWDGLHYVRVGFIVAAFVLLVLAGVA